MPSLVTCLFFLFIDLTIASSDSLSSTDISSSSIEGASDVSSGSASSSPASADSSLAAPSLSTLYQTLSPSSSGLIKKHPYESRNDESFVHFLPTSVYLQNGYSLPSHNHLSLRPSAMKSIQGLPNGVSKVLTNVERSIKQIPYFISNLLSTFRSRRDSTELSRQIFDMVDIVTDVAMLTLIGIPVLGLVAVGATALSPLLGVASSAAAASSAASLPAAAAVSPSLANARNKRSIFNAISSSPNSALRRTGTLKGNINTEKHNNSQDDQVSPGFIERASNAILYTKKLYDLVSKLDDLFAKYRVTGNDCQLRAICDVHRVGKNSEYKDFGDTIISLFKMEKSVEKYETIPLARLFFQMYTDAANFGAQLQDCSTLYPRCDRETISFVKRAKHNTKMSGKGKSSSM